MKRLLLILIFTLSFQTLSKADDIRDFEIEGMSIGDSALDFFTESQIKSNKRNWYKDKKFYGVLIKIQSEKYDDIQLHFKTGDKKYIIHAVGGIKDYNNDNIEDCYPLKKEVGIVISELFTNSKIYHHGKSSHPGDESGKSTIEQSFFNLSDGTVVSACVYWPKGDSDFRLIANTMEINNWYGVAY